MTWVWEEFDMTRRTPADMAAILALKTILLPTDHPWLCAIRPPVVTQKAAENVRVSSRGCEPSVKITAVLRNEEGRVTIRFVCCARELVGTFWSVFCIPRGF